MAKMTIGVGIEQYLAQLKNLEFESPHIAGKAVYEGAKIVADALKQEIEALPVEESRKRSGDDMAHGVTMAQKKGLRFKNDGGGTGIAKMRADGSFYNVKIGFHGYNGTATKKYPNGQPNAMIARSVESGTSFRRKNPFISRAVRKSRAAAEKKMAQVVDEEVKKIMK